jgi:hypothetical protein
LRGCKTFRCGGQLQTVASQHTLLVVALTVALRDIPARDITRLLAERRRLKKPRLIVRCTDKNFIAAMQHLATGQETGDVPTLRAGRNFLGMLLYQISRFTIEYEYAEPQEATDVMVVAHWVNQHVHDPKQIEDIPQILRPTSVSVVL